MKKNELRSQVALAVRASQEKKADDITVLQLDESSSARAQIRARCRPSPMKSTTG
jgi:hypothetical protein